MLESINIITLREKQCQDKFEILLAFTLLGLHVEATRIWDSEAHFTFKFYGQIIQIRQITLTPDWFTLLGRRIKG